MDDWVSKAQRAAANSDWAVVLAHLQEWCEQDAIQPFDDATRQSALGLALQCLENGCFQTRWDVAKMIPQFGAIALPSLLDIIRTTEFDDEEWEFHWFAARLIGEFDHPDAIAALLSLLESDTPDLVQVASDALASRGALMVERLAAASAHPAARRGIVRALARIDHPSVVEPLLSLAEDEQLEVRAIALEALIRFPDARISPLLVQALSNPSAQVRQAAVTGIGLHARCFETARAVELIEPLLRDLNAQVARQAAIALGRVGTPEALLVLDQAWRSPYSSESLKHEIVQVLGHAQQDDALALLEQYLITLLSSAEVNEENQFRLSQAIISVVGRTESLRLRPQAVTILVKALQHCDRVAQRSQLWQAIAFSLGQLQDPQAVDVLIQMLAEDDASIRLHAIAALRQIAPVETRARIEQLSNEKTASLSLQQGAAFALAEWPV